MTENIFICDLGSHAGILFPFWSVGFRTKFGHPNAWNCLKSLSPLVPVKIFFLVTPDSNGALLIISTEYRTTKDQKETLISVGHCIIACSDMGIVRGITNPMVVSTTPFSWLALNLQKVCCLWAAMYDSLKGTWLKIWLSARWYLIFTSHELV